MVQLGTSKITQAAFQAAGVGLHGVSFNPSEVSLSAGQTYAIVFKVVDPPPTSDGFNVMVSDDPYPDGHGVWWNDKEAVWVDKSLTVASTVMEYTC